jgi:NTP pyrophosphatase (non-canonical NTP hydrolase)
MFDEIYPASRRNIHKAGVHLAEEIGELSEAILAYRGEHTDEHFKSIVLEAADLFSHYLCVFNSLGHSLAKGMSEMFSENCHICHKAPCECTFNFVIKYL